MDLLSFICYVCYGAFNWIKVGAEKWVLFNFWRSVWTLWCYWVMSVTQTNRYDVCGGRIPSIIDRLILLAHCCCWQTLVMVTTMRSFNIMESILITLKSLKLLTKTSHSLSVKVMSELCATRVCTVWPRRRSVNNYTWAFVQWISGS